jgi:L-2-hydroxyglutarate oxidase LhgO
MISFPGFWKVAGRNLRTGIAETERSLHVCNAPSPAATAATAAIPIGQHIVEKIASSIS